MLVLIDESGCAGFQLNKGSSRYFTIAMVVFSDFLEAEKASYKITELKKTLRVNPEFKFSHSHPNVKNTFFTDICDYDFSVRAVVVEKEKIKSAYLKNKPDNFYNYFLKVLLEYDAGMLQNAVIKIDGRGTRGFVRNLKSYLRAQVNVRKIKKIKLVDSGQDNLIQLADMVVGAIAKAYSSNCKNERRWLEILQNRGKIDNIWQFQ